MRVAFANDRAQLQRSNALRPSSDAMSLRHNGVEWIVGVEISICTFSLILPLVVIIRRINLNGRQTRRPESGCTPPRRVHAVLLRVDVAAIRTATSVSLVF